MDKRRPLPRYATAFCEMWAEHVRQVFPITPPTEPNSAPVKRVAARKARALQPASRSTGARARAVLMRSDASAAGSSDP